MLLPPLHEVLTLLGLESHLSSSEDILLVRHDARGWRFFNRGLEVFEEYQRFQGRASFSKCRIVLAFIGLPGPGKAATFAGAYEVLGVKVSGQDGFREPQGDPEVVLACQGERYLYHLSRMTHFDWLRTQWNIQWDSPENLRHRYLREGMTVHTLRLGPARDSSSAISWLKQYSFTEGTESIEDPDATSFSEGAAAYTRHLKRERNSALVALVKERARAANEYRCFVCDFDFARTYGLDYLECHHTVAVASMMLGHKTRPEDCVLLCANCHRAVHKQPRWLSKAELGYILLTSR